MSYELLRYGAPSEEHFVAEISEEGTCIALYSVRRKEINEFSESPEVRVFVEMLGDVAFSTNDLDNSTGTQAEAERFAGSEPQVIDYEFANPRELETVEDALELADYERALRREQSQVCLGVDIGTWSVGDLLDMLADAEEYISAGNKSIVERMLETIRVLAEYHSDEALDRRLADVCLALGID